MNVSQRLYEKALPIWESYYQHPFVHGIADGTLPVEKFQFYMIQDHKYLMQYAKVFALGLIKADQESDMRLFSGLITATLDTENAVHQSYLGKLGITRELIDATPMCLNNASYTNYMISISFKEGLAELMTAVLACSWSYAEIGARLAEIPGAAEHPFYGEWIRGYAGEDYQRTNDALVELMDRLAAGCSEQEYARLEEIFVHCSRYELGFWDMAWKLEQ